MGEKSGGGGGTRSTEQLCTCATLTFLHFIMTYVYWWNRTPSSWHTQHTRHTRHTHTPQSGEESGRVLLKAIGSEMKIEKNGKTKKGRVMGTRLVHIKQWC